MLLRLRLRLLGVVLLVCVLLRVLNVAARLRGGVGRDRVRSMGVSLCGFGRIKQLAGTSYVLGSSVHLLRHVLRGRRSFVTNTRTQGQSLCSL